MDPKRRRPVDRCERYVSPEQARIPTLAERVCYLPTIEQRIELERFRIEFEEKHGPTVLDKLYSCVMPPPQQQKLFDRSPQEWFDLLPAFLKEFFEIKLAQVHESRQMEETEGMPEFLRLYLGPKLGAVVSPGHGRSI